MLAVIRDDALTVSDCPRTHDTTIKMHGRSIADRLGQFGINYAAAQDAYNAFLSSRIDELMNPRQAPWETLLPERLPWRHLFPRGVGMCQVYLVSAHPRRWRAADSSPPSLQQVEPLRPVVRR